MIFTIPEEHLSLRPEDEEDLWNYHVKGEIPPLVGLIAWINSRGASFTCEASALSWDAEDHPVVWWRYA